MLDRSLRLLLVAALVVLIAEPARGQFRFRGAPRFFQQFDIEAEFETAEAAETPATDPPTVDELLQRLDELEARNAAPTSRERGLAMILEQPHLGSTNYYDPTGLRYFSVRLVLINLTDQAVTLSPQAFALEADGQQRSLTESAERLSRSILQVGGEQRRYEAPAEPLEIPPRGTASQWLAFAVDSTAPVPALSLLIEREQGSEKLDVNAYERGVLGLKSERVGPRNCAALLTIAGELNTINSATLADELDDLSAVGVVRAVVAWGDAAARLDDQVLGWLMMGSSQDGGLQYAQLPQIPAAVTELHLVRPPGHEPSPWQSYEQFIPMHDSADVAMLAALRTAFESVTRDDLRAELRQGHRLSRAAALAHAGARLGPRDLPLVLAACDSNDPFLQAQALAALGQFSDAEAVQRLLAAASSTDPTLMQAAVGSLAGSRFPQDHAALRDFLADLDDTRKIAVVDVLARFPRREWIDRIAEHQQSSDPHLKLAALRALVRLGHPEIVDLLQAALQSENPELVTEAYSQLAARSDARSERLAADHALKLLEQSPPDATTQIVLSRTLDRRAIPHLVRHLDAAQENERDALVQLLLQIGGTEVVPELLTRYPQLSSTAQSGLLEILRSSHAPSARPLALEALKSDDSQLVDVAVRILTARPESTTAATLIEALDQNKSAEAWNSLCSGLARIGDRESRDALLARRRSEDLQMRGAAINGLTMIKQTSPAYQFSAHAAQLLEQSAEVTEEELRTYRRQAEKLLDLAISFDSEYAEAYAQRGHILLLQQKLPAAQADFDHAVRLDPFDPLGITGQAIVAVLQGDPERGVRQIREVADQFPGDVGFEYNSACVYGRAVEALQKSDRPDSATLQAEYRSDALKHLRNSLLLGFPTKEFIEKDPDLAVFHDDPTYQDLLQNPPVPGEEELEQMEALEFNFD